MRSQDAGFSAASQFDTHSPGTTRATLQDLRRAARRYRQEGAPEKAAWALLAMGRLLRERHDPHAALPLLNEARRIFETGTDRFGLACALHELAVVHRDMDRNTVALELGREAARIFQEEGRTVEAGWAYDNLAFVQFHLFNRQESLALANRARAIFTEFRVYAGLAWNSCTLGNLFLQMGFYPEAGERFSEAYTIFAQRRNQRGMAWSLLGLGMLHRAQARYEQAQEALGRSKALYREMGLKDGVARCMLSEAAIKRVTGRDEDAMLLNRRALQVFSPMRNHDGVGWGLFQVAQILRDRGLALKSWQVLRDAHNLHNDIANRIGVGWIACECGRAYMEMGDALRAKDAFVRAKVIADRLDDLSLKIEIDKNLSRLYLSEGALQKAGDLLEATLGVSRRIQGRAIEVELLLERARHALLIGDVPVALETARTAEGLIEAHNINLFRSRLGVVLGEALACGGRMHEAALVWWDAVRMARKMNQRPQVVEAMIGLIQAAELPAAETLEADMEKEAASCGSRALKAKVVLMRAVKQSRQSGRTDGKNFSASRQIASDAGLRVLEKQILDVQSDVTYALSQSEEKAGVDSALAALLEQSTADLHLVRPRREVCPQLPVSLVA